MRRDVTCHGWALICTRTWPRCPSVRDYFHSGRSEISNFCGLENFIFRLDAGSTGSLLSPESILDLTSFAGDDEPLMVTAFFFFCLFPFL